MCVKYSSRLDTLAQKYRNTVRKGVKHTILIIKKLCAR